MNLNWTSSVLAFVLSMNVIFFHSEAFRVRVCGKQLADLVQLVCSDRGGLYSPDSHRPIGRIRKRSIFPVTGIVSECCLRSCTLSVLHQYCQEPMVDDNEIEDPRRYSRIEKYRKFEKLNNADSTKKFVVDSKKKESSPRGPSIGYHVRDRPYFLSRYY